MEIAATGGGVLLLAYHYSGSTPDLDSIIRSSEDAGAELSLVVDEVASDYGFGPRWLNESVGNKVPAARILGTVDRRETFGKNLTVGYVSEEFLLASKCQAARDKDIPQVTYLLRSTGMTDASVIIRATMKHFPEKNNPVDCEHIEAFIDECLWGVRGW